MLHVLFSRSKGLGAALAVLTLSAGVAFAGAGPNLHINLTGANNGVEASEAPESDAPESEAPESEAPESEAPDASEAPEAPDAGGASTDTHGALVSAAAQMPTPAGFRNHGAFVSCVAHMKDVTLATIDWSTVTPAACMALKHGHGGSN